MKCIMAIMRCYTTPHPPDMQFAAACPQIINIYHQCRRIGSECFGRKQFISIMKRDMQQAAYGNWQELIMKWIVTNIYVDEQHPIKSVPLEKSDKRALLFCKWNNSVWCVVAFDTKTWIIYHWTRKLHFLVHCKEIRIQRMIKWYLNDV